MRISRKSPARLRPLLLPAPVRRLFCSESALRSAASFSACSPSARSARPPVPTEITAKPKTAFDPYLGTSLPPKSRSAQFGIVQDLGERTFTDLYFDDPDSSYPLTTRNVWLRTRGCAWHMKAPLESTTAVSGGVILHEIDGTEHVLDRLEVYSTTGVIRPRSWSDAALEIVRADGLRSPSDVRAFLQTCYNLVPFCSFTTTRKSFVLDNRFRLDLDTDDFGHDVGELQLVVPLPHSATPEQTRRVLRAAEQSIGGFYKRHEWYFNPKRPKGGKKAKADDEPTTGFGSLGKLPAYIQRFNPEQWNALVNAGIFQGKRPDAE